MSPEDYEKNVRSSILAGQRFRESLSQKPPVGIDIVHLYSGSSRMPYGYRIKRDPSTGWFKVIASRNTEFAGDGRVLVESAMNEGFGGTLSVQRFQLTEKHGALIKDAALVSYVRDNVVRVRNADTVAALAEILDNEESRKLLLDSKMIFDPALAYSSTGSIVAIAQIKIANFNAESIAPGAKDKGIALRAYASNWNTAKEKPSLAAALWESSILLDPSYAESKSILPLIDLRVQQNQIFELYGTANRVSPIGNNATATARERPWKSLIRKGIVDHELRLDDSSIMTTNFDKAWFPS